MSMAIHNASLSLISSCSSSPRPAVHQQFPTTTVSSLGYVRLLSFKAGAKLAGGGGLSPLLLRTMHRDEGKTSISVGATKAKDFFAEENDYYPDATTEEREFNFEFNLDDIKDFVGLIKKLTHLGYDVIKGTAVVENSICKVKTFVKQSTHMINFEDIFSDGQYFLDVDSPQTVKFTNEGKKSVWHIEKAGKSLKLFIEIIEMIELKNIDITSIEFDTQGFVLKLKFHLSYKDHALDGSLQQALTNGFFNLVSYITKQKKRTI